MSAYAAFSNPTPRTLQAGGSGLLPPVLTTTQRLAVAAPDLIPGIVVFDSTLNQLFYWNGSAWVALVAGGGGGGGASATNQWLLENVAAVQFTAQTRDADSVVTTATALWPDGSAGTYTLVTKNATWKTADAWTLTHALSGKTLTQAAVTRNASGYSTTTPAITIA